jgi:hypothetical protein
MLPKVSIIVTNYNGREVIHDCLESLSKINYPKNRYEIIFVDNNSTDDSVSYVKRKFPSVNLFALKKNIWFTGANNFGVKKARGDYIVFLNNDTAVDKNWLMELVKVAQSDKKIGVCGSKIVHFTNPKFIQYAGAYLDILGSPFTRKFQERDTRLEKNSIEVFYAPGMSLLIKREVLEKLKYCFDPSFLAYFEEIDLCWRVKLLGYKVMYVPTSRVLHRGSFTFKRQWSETQLLHYRNKILTFKKNLRFPLKQIILIFVLTRMLFPVLSRIIKSKGKYGITILKNISDKPNPDVDLKRISLKIQLNILSLPIFSKYSQYFLLKKMAKEL